jgi:hypothetical protein
LDSYEPDFGYDVSGVVAGDNTQCCKQQSYSQSYSVEASACCYGADGLGFSYAKVMRAAPPSASHPQFRKEAEGCMQEVFYGECKASHCKVDNQLTVTTSMTNYFIVQHTEEQWSRE